MVGFVLDEVCALTGTMKLVSLIVTAVLVSATAAVAAGGLRQKDPVYVYRYRLTLEIEAEGVVHRGSSVVQAESYRELSGGVPAGVFVGSWGEATVVDLGKGRVVVALLDGVDREPRWRGRHDRQWIGPTPDGVLTRLYRNFKYEWRGQVNDGLALLSVQRGIHELSADQLPTIVTFRDIGDPNSIGIVDPNNLAAFFGTGVQFRRATIELTGDDVTVGVVEDTLPWLRRIKGYLSGKGYCDAPKNRPPELPFCPDRGLFVRKSI